MLGDARSLRLRPSVRPPLRRFDSFIRRSTSCAAPNAGSLFPGCGRARKDRDRLEGLVGWSNGAMFSAPHYAATCTEDQRDKGNIAGQVARIPCCVLPWKAIGRNVNGHLIGTRERILIRLHRESNHLAKSNVMQYPALCRGAAQGVP